MSTNFWMCSATVQLTIANRSVSLLFIYLFKILRSNRRENPITKFFFLYSQCAEKLIINQVNVLYSSQSSGKPTLCGHVLVHILMTLQILWLPHFRVTAVAWLFN